MELNGCGEACIGVVYIRGLAEVFVADRTHMGMMCFCVLIDWLRVGLRLALYGMRCLGRDSTVWWV